MPTLPLLRFAGLAVTLLVTGTLSGCASEDTAGVSSDDDIDRLPSRVTTVDAFRLTDSQVARLAKHSQIISLDLGHCPEITDVSLRTVAGMTNLRRLYLDRTGITDRGLAHLKLSRLEFLNVTQTQITDAGMREIAEIKTLKKLHIKRCKRITDLGVAAICKLDGLEEFHASDTLITDNSLVHLASLKKLVYLQIIHCPNITNHGIQKFIRQRPDCDVDYRGTG